MQSVLEYLKQLDLSEIEAKIYLTLIEGGPKRVRELAESVGLKRTTTYFYIDLLVKKGLVAEDMKVSGSRITANPPQWLKYLVDKKIKTAQILQEQYPTVIKTIGAHFSKTQAPEDETEIKYFKGINNIRLIYEEALSGNELRSYVNIEEIAAVFPENFKVFDNALRQNPNLKIFEIVENSPSTKKRIKTSNQKHLYKTLPKNIKLTAQDILIYNNKVSIIHLKEKTNGITLHNQDLYNNFRMLFDFIWKILPESNNKAD